MGSIDTSLFNNDGSPMPEFDPAPAEFETNFGTLEFVGGGFPTPDTAQRVFDEMDLQRATQAYMDFYPALSLLAMLKGQVANYGVRGCSDVIVFADKMNSTPLWLTGNTDSIYALVTLDLKEDGPTVIEIPPGVLGPADDAYFKFIMDFGPTGQDQGKGGKYLMLPPGYTGEVPDGYFVVESPTNRVWPMMRADAALVGTGEKAFAFYRDHLKVYPLATGPTEGRYINGSGMGGNQLAPENMRAFEWLAEIVEHEPGDIFNKEQLGRLASLGIEKGKPFAPDDRMRKILAQGAKQGVAMARTIAFANRDPEVRVYPDRRWETLFIGGSSEFLRNGYRNIDARTLFHYTAVVVTPAMAARMVGKGSQYLAAYRDANDAYLDGAKTYKLHVPPNVPVKAFWSVTLYDPATRSQLQTPQGYPSVNSQKNPDTNADGSIDIYFGPTAPEGKEHNWVQTVPGKGWFTLFRFYGPLEDYLDRVWKPDDIVEVT